MWFRCRIQPVFRAFFFIIQFFSFKTACFFPKLVNREKVFRIFSVQGVRKLRFFRLLVEGGTKHSLGKEAVDAVGKDDSLSLRSIFNMIRRRLIIVSGVVLFALPTPGASKIGAEEGCTGEEPQGLLIFRAKATAESCTGCSIRMYA